MEVSEVKINNEEAMQDLLDDRGIILEDVRKTIAAAETTGRKLVSVDDENRFLAKNRMENINIYAEYTPTADGFELHTAYAHRVMLVSEDQA
jgi:hypothetical protein